MTYKRPVIDYRGKVSWTPISCDVMPWKTSELLALCEGNSPITTDSIQKGQLCIILRCYPKQSAEHTAGGLSRLNIHVISLWWSDLSDIIIWNAHVFVMFFVVVIEWSVVMGTCAYIFIYIYIHRITVASQITGLTIVYPTLYSGVDKKCQSSASLAFVRGIHRGSVNSPHKGPVTWKMFPFDDVIMV